MKKVFKIAGAIVLAFVALSVLISPSEEERLQQLADSKGITLEQLKTQIAEEEAFRKKYALPNSYSYASEKDKMKHIDAVDNNLTIEFMEGNRATENFTNMISQVMKRECSSVKYMYDVYNEKYSEAVGKWNRLPKHVKSSFNNDMMQEPQVEWAASNLRQQGLTLADCNMNAIRSRGYAFIYVN